MSSEYKLTVIGEIPASWETSKLRDVAEVLPSNVDKKIISGEKKVRLCNYMDVYKNNYITPSLNLSIGSATDAEIEKFLLKKGDVIITKDSETKEDIAQSAAVIENFDDVLCGYHLALIRPKSRKINGLLLAKLFEIPQVRKQLVNKANGTTRFGLSIGTIQDLIIPVPEIQEQQKIAEILSTIDEKIEVIEEQITQTTELKKGLMQQLLTKGIGHTAFKDSPLGEIPESWEVYKLGDLLEKSPEYGANASATAYSDNTYRYVRITDISEDGNLINTGIVGILKSEGEQYLLNEDDIVIARTGNTVGKSYLHKSSNGNCAYAGYLIRFVLDPKRYLPHFLFHYLHSEIFWIWVKSTLRTGAQPNINSKEYQSLKLPVPTIEEQMKIVSILNVLGDKIEVLKCKMRSFDELKKGLMQQLLTGKLRVNSLIENEVLA